MEHKSLNFSVKADDVNQDEMTFKGYASTWDLDQGGDVIEKGAFAKTLSSRGEKVKILWQHNMNSPIGRPTLMREDENGLYVEGKLSNTELGRDAMTLLRDGVIDQMSIGYIANEADYEDGVRKIKEAELFEFSLVSFPMNEKAVVTQVKNLHDVRELERVLCEVGYSNSQARKMACASIKSLREVGDEAKALADLQQAISNFSQTLGG